MNIPQLFPIASADKSLEYLGIIFGSMHGVINPPGLTPNFTTVLGSLFGTMNSVILTIGALMVVYMIVVGLLNTAHEGQFMGKNWNNLWIPIRVVVGISAMIPLTSGYSGLQLVMMWFIVQGVGAADMAWSRALLFVQQYSIFGTSTTNSSLQADFAPSTTEIQQNLRSLFMAMVCYKSTAFNLANPNSGFGSEGGYYCHDNGSTNFCRNKTGPANFTPAIASPTYQNGGTSYEMGPEGGCGTLNFCDLSSEGSCRDPNSMQCNACRASRQALTTIIPDFARIGEFYTFFDYDYQSYFNASSIYLDDESGSRPNPPDWLRPYCADTGKSECDASDLPSPNVRGKVTATPDVVVDEIYWKYGLCPALGGTPDDCKGRPNMNNFYVAAVETYTLGIKAAIDGFLAPNSPGAVSQLNDTTQNMANTGWILAGSFYQKIARMNGSNVSNSSPTFSIDLNSDRSPSNPDSDLGQYRVNLDAAGRLIDKISGSARPGSDKAVQSVATPTNAASNDSSKAYKRMVEASNPLAALSVTGYIMLMVAFVLYIVMLVVAVLMGIGSLSFYVLGTGVTNPVGYIGTFVYFFVVPLIFMFLGVLVTVGGTFAVYIPMIPYVIFTMGAIAWLISTVEAMVAGPIVALGILSPSGHHEILGKAEPALLLLFNIFLRPTLMLFGLFAAMLLSSAVITMINAGFGSVVENLFDFGDTGGGIAAAAANPLALVFILVAYVSIICSAFNKCFSIIHILPDRVITWIGGHAGQGGEAEGVHDMKGALGGAGAEAKGHVAGGSKEAIGRAEKSSEGRDMAVTKEASEKKKGDGGGKLS